MRSTIALVCAAMLAGCAGQTRYVEKSGFLEDYSKLEEGRSGESLLFYAKPGLDFTRYDKVLIEPITVWAPEDSDLADVPKEELDQLAKIFYDSVKKEMARGDKQIVEYPGPNTARIRLALTEATDTFVSGNVVTTIHPISLVAGEVVGFATGTRLFVGKASMEMEIRDAMSGEVLMQGVDRRQGDKGFDTGDWTHVKEHMAYWAAWMRERIQAASPQAKQG